MRTGRILMGIIAVLLLIGVVAGVGWSAYNAGIAQGMATSGNAVPPTAPFVAPYGFYRPFGFGFGLLGCLIPLFFLFLLFGLFRFAFFGPMWRRRWGGPGWYRGGWDPAKGDIPPAVQEWHRKLHEQDAPTAPPTNQTS